MNFKFNKISKIILGVVAIMLASCSSELNGNDNNAVSVTGTLSAHCLYRLRVLHARLLV